MIRVALCLGNISETHQENDDSESGESGENLSQTHSGESGESTDTMLDLLPRINQEHTCLAIPLGV